MLVVGDGAADATLCFAAGVTPGTLSAGFGSAVCTTAAAVSRSCQLSRHTSPFSQHRHQPRVPAGVALTADTSTDDHPSEVPGWLGKDHSELVTAMWPTAAGWPQLDVAATWLTAAGWTQPDVAAAWLQKQGGHIL